MRLRAFRYRHPTNFKSSILYHYPNRVIPGFNSFFCALIKSETNNRRPPGRCISRRRKTVPSPAAISRPDLLILTMVPGDE